ncbi:MAG TPA: hypothetical protein VFB77_14130 [Acidimicrobiales bacterium]|nr:hypothetical protein [Acidimicrobiales bacterium]
MTLVWAVPALAAAVAVVCVLVRARALEDATADLAAEVGRLRRLREPLDEVRRAAADTDRLAADFRDAHPLDADRGGE